MTLIDSLDSVVMLYSYSGFPERSFALFERRVPPTLPQSAPDGTANTSSPPLVSPPLIEGVSEGDNNNKKAMYKASTVQADDGEEERRTFRVKNNAMSNLSILLTVMSILVAFRYGCLTILCNTTDAKPFDSISLITTMGLIGDNCTPCQNAAGAEDGGGLAGRWWRGWANVS